MPRINLEKPRVQRSNRCTSHASARGLTVEREAFPGLYAAFKAVFSLYVEVVKQGQERESIIDGDPGGLAGVLWSLLHGVAILVIENQIRPYAEGPEGIEGVTRYSVQLLYEGLGRK